MQKMQQTRNNANIKVTITATLLNFRHTQTPKRDIINVTETQHSYAINYKISSITNTFGKWKLMWIIMATVKLWIFLCLDKLLLIQKDMLHTVRSLAFPHPFGGEKIHQYFVKKIYANIWILSKMYTWHLPTGPLCTFLNTPLVTNVSHNGHSLMWIH